MPNRRLTPRRQAFRHAASKLAVTALLLPLLACETVSPDIALPIPTGFRAQRSGAAAPVARDWVKTFGSPELNRLVAGALAENLDIAGAVARIQEAEAQAVVARAALYPTLGGSTDASRSQTSGAGRSGSGFTSNTFSLGLNASYILDLFGRNGFAASAAELTARASVFDRDTLALSTVAGVANTYFTVLSSQDRLRLAEENVRIAGRLLEAVQARLKAGTGNGLDVAQQESVVATQRARIPPLFQQVLQSKNTLAVLLGRSPESVGIRGGSLDGLRVPAVRAGLPSQLLLRRPDIGAAEANLASSEASVAAARAAFFPTIQLTANGGLQSAALKSLFGPNAVFYSIAAGLAQPLFDGFQLQGQLDLQRGRTAELAAAYKKSIVQSFADVENALIAVQQNTEYEIRLRQAVDASRRALDIVEGQLRQGTIDVTTLFTVQNTLFGNQDALAQARFLRFQAVVSLYQALGGGWTQTNAVPVGRVAEAAAP